MVPNKRLITTSGGKMAPALRVAPENAPLVVAPHSFGVTKPHSSRLNWRVFRRNRGDDETSTDPRNFDSFKPYFGMLHRTTFIKGRENLSAIGARAGFFLQSSTNLVMRAGLVAIRYQDCDRIPYADCTDVSPEISAGFYF